MSKEYFGLSLPLVRVLAPHAHSPHGASEPHSEDIPVCRIAIPSVSSPSSLLFLASSSALCIRFHSSRHDTISLSGDTQRLFFLLFGSLGALSEACCWAA